MLIMEKINLGSFYIEEYDETNIDHKSTMVTLSNQDDFMYIGDLFWLEEEFRIAKEKGKEDTLNIAFIGDVPVGMIGFNVLEGHFYLMVAILPQYRGQSYASRLVLEYAKFLFTKYPEIPDVHASIHMSNRKSLRSAQKAGFVPSGKSRNNTNYVLKR